MVKRHNKRLKSKKSFKLKLKPGTVYSIVEITFFSLAGLIMISYLRQGAILILLNSFLKLYLGWTSVFLPFIFILFGLLVSKFRIFLTQANVVLGMLIFFIAASTLTKSGILGFKVWLFTAGLFTTAGAYVVSTALTLVGLVILFNTSVDHFLRMIVIFFKTYIFRGWAFKKPVKFASSRQLKIFGGSNSSPAQSAKVINPVTAGSEKVEFEKEPAEQTIVSNIPGEEIVWKYPDLSILSDENTGKADRGDIKKNAGIIENRLDSFGITAHVVEVNQGPAVTQYALDVAIGTKLSKITALERDLALALAASTGTIRIEAPIPGRSLVGIELPNISPEFVPLKRMLQPEIIGKYKTKLSVALGLDVSGKEIVADISRMPHVLIAGQTGSGKSVCINTFLSTLLMRTSPAELRLILVDPKRVELTTYDDIPHLLSPVIVDPKLVIKALNWLMKEMDRRYHLFAQAGARNIESYNKATGFQSLPYILLFIDELADIMLFSPAEVEDAITRIAQMSRATGIHMVLATQRPSVDIITGLIKANVPCRIAFAVASQVDSRVILDAQGAEKLLGRGDMLYLSPDQAKPTRIQGAFVSEEDVKRLVSYLKSQGVKTQYTEEVTTATKPGTVPIPGVEGGGESDKLLVPATELVCQARKASTSMLQRRLSIGYSRAAKIIDQMESLGIVAPSDGSSKPREVLISSPSDIFQSSSN